MNKTVGYAFMWIIIVALIVVGAIFLVKAGNKPGQYDEFAQCIDESGAKFYGAFWCPHCQNQKQLFGKSAEYLPYIECATTDGEDQNEICEQQGVKGYPTWIFADGSREAREMSLEELAEKTGCELKSDSPEAQS